MASGSKSKTLSSISTSDVALNSETYELIGKLFAPYMPNKHGENRDMVTQQTLPLEKGKKGRHTALGPYSSFEISLGRCQVLLP